MDPQSHQPQEDGFFYPRDGACPVDPSQRTECKAQSSISVHMVQKADREKMRRDKLNEQFQELGNALGMMQFFFPKQSFSQLLLVGCPGIFLALVASMGSDGNIYTVKLQFP